MKLTKTKLSKFKKLFEEKEKAITKAQMMKSVETFDTGIDGDEVDVVQGAILKDISDKLCQRDIDSLRRIGAALQRIEDGSFGICKDCEEPIPEKRLIVVPDCETCVDCAEEQEKFSKQFRG